MSNNGVVFGALLFGAVAGCHRQASPAPTATLVLSVTPTVATVLLDDQPLLVRSASGGPVPLMLLSPQVAVTSKNKGLINHRYLVRFMSAPLKS